MGANREIVLIVDDDMVNLTVARNALVDKYEVFTAPSGKKMFQILERIVPALILLDIEMPEMNGYEIIKLLKHVDRTSGIPVIFLTAKNDPASEVKGLDLGAVDYIMKPFSQELLSKRVEMHIIFEAQKLALKHYALDLEGEVIRKSQTVLELQGAILKTVAELVECRDNVTGGHIARTQNYLTILVDFMLEHGVYAEELRSWDTKLFVLSSQLHDVGKISIKDDILMKPGKLTVEEFEQMKKHTIFGMDIIEKVKENTTDNRFLLYAKALAGSHHEKWNGKGYPFGLKGPEIPLSGRMMAIVDVYDALTNDRPYKKAFSHEKSVEIIKGEKGTHFDPFIVNIFLMHEKEFKKIADEKSRQGGGNVSRIHADGLNSTSNVVANILDVRSGMKNGNAERMKHYLTVFIDALLVCDLFKDEVSSWNVDIFLMSAQLHDVGKIAVSDNLLYKSDKLTADEYEDVKTHANFGVKVVNQIKENVNDRSLLNHAEALTGSHHEKWDGTGYPLGLKGKEIPLQGRIMAIIDVYDALTSNRPHRKMITQQESVDIIKGLSGTHFDPDLVDVFLKCEKSFNVR